MGGTCSSHSGDVNGKLILEKSEGEIHVVRFRFSLQDNIKFDFKDMGCKDLD
jgi:hypothetical protein